MFINSAINEAIRDKETRCAAISADIKADDTLISRLQQLGITASAAPAIAVADGQAYGALADRLAGVGQAIDVYQAALAEERTLQQRRAALAAEIAAEQAVRARIRAARAVLAAAFAVSLYGVLVGW